MLALAMNGTMIFCYRKKLYPENLFCFSVISRSLIDITSSFGKLPGLLDVSENLIAPRLSKNLSKNLSKKIC